MDETTLHPTTFISKIVNTTKERLCLHMPHFYNHKNTNDFGNITVIPKGIRWFRFFGYSPIPYVTMNRVRFTLRVERLPYEDGISRHLRNVYMQLADGSYRTAATIYNKETSVEGTIMYTGDTKFYISSSSYTDRNSERFIAEEGILLFEDKVQHMNDYIFGGCSFAVLAITVIGVLLAWLLGIIQIDPTWIARFNP